MRVSELLIILLAERQRIQRLRLEKETMGLLASGSVRASRGGEDPSSVIGCATPVVGHEGGGVAESQVCGPGQDVLGLEWRAEGVGMMKGGEPQKQRGGGGIGGEHTQSALVDTRSLRSLYSSRTFSGFFSQSILPVVLRMFLFMCALLNQHITLG